MGFLSKIFKPVSKVLDKIVPNEIKPFLPYAAAFAPMLLPQTGIMSSMLGRGLTSGGLNIGAQLAQEGSEGDFNKLSALIAGGLGSLSAQGTPGTTGPAGPPGSELITTPGTQSAGEYLKGLSSSGGIGDKTLDFLGTGADRLQGINAAGAADPFSMAGLKAAVLPFSQGSGDVMYAESREAQKDYERALAEYEASSGEGANDEGRAMAIRSAMEAGQHDESVIIETLQALGLYANGGRVNAMDGGIMSNQRMNFAGGGMDYMPTEPRMMGNPAVMEMIEPGDDMRENRIMNPDVEDVADYSIELKEETKEPDFGGITEAVQKRPADSMLMSIAKEVGPMLLGIPGMAYLAGKSAYKMFKNLQKEDQEKVVEISKTMITKNNSGGEEVMVQNKADGGMMSVLPEGMEMDYRGGGFIPMGSKERADDVPARVSKNEFVMTADAVKAAGGGSVNEGARKMYNLMNNLEARA